MKWKKEMKLDEIRLDWKLWKLVPQKALAFGSFAFSYAYYLLLFVTNAQKLLPFGACKVCAKNY